MKKLKIVAIGSGNVATHLIPSLHKKGHSILQVYSRKLKNAKLLADRVSAQAIHTLDSIIENADVYLIMVPDDVITIVSNDLKGKIVKSAIILHSSGSKSSKLLKGVTAHYGVLYPLQSFTKKGTVDLPEVPIFTTANSKAAKTVVKQLASDLSKHVISLSDKKRKELHLAAVVCNNFVHHLFVKSDAYLKTKRIPFKYLFPLISKTLETAHLTDLKNNQTGPAKRNDTKTIKEHLQILESDPDFKKLYASLSRSINKTHS